MFIKVKINFEVWKWGVRKIFSINIEKKIIEKKSIYDFLTNECDVPWSLERPFVDEILSLMHKSTIYNDEYFSFT